MNEITRILEQLAHESNPRTDRLFELVYQELRQLASAKMKSERAGHTLDATSLVHEAFMRLDRDPLHWQSRRHFFAAAAEAMRRILIDHARARQAKKRGGEVVRAQLDLDAVPQLTATNDRVLALHQAIEQLEASEPDKAELVKLRYFGGLTIKEAAQLLGISTATADRKWAYARAWLQRAISETEA